MMITRRLPSNLPRIDTPSSGRTSTTRLTLALFTLLLAAVTVSPTTISQPARGAEFEELRDCTVWLRGGEGASATLRWEAYYANDCTADLIHFLSPGGVTLERIEIPFHDPGGARQLAFSEGPGDYRIEVPGFFSRKVYVSAGEGVSMVMEPAKGHSCAHTTIAPWWFFVPEGTLSFTLCGDYEIGAVTIHLYDPAGELYDTLSLTTLPITLHFDRLAVDRPMSGFWRIEFAEHGKIGFWVDGIPNYFAHDPEQLFVPEWTPGLARFTGDGATGPAGLLGASSIMENSPQELVEQVQHLGLESMCKYVEHGYREPFNEAFPAGGDNGDPRVFNWSWFYWEDWRIDFLERNFGAKLSNLIVASDSWLGPPRTDREREEYAEFILAYITHYNADQQQDLGWFSPWDEPNLSTFTYEEYELLLRAVAGRVKDPANPPEVLAAPLLAVSTTGFDSTGAGPDRIGMIWAERLYACCDPLVDGIAFDYWSIHDLIGTWRIGRAVDLAADIIATHDTDGDLDETIVINQTTMCPGPDSSAYDVNTHFGARWLAGAVCSAFGQGKLDVFQYWTTVDDLLMKGLVYSDQPPPALPYRDRAEPFEMKPIGHAMAMMTDVLLDGVLIIEGESEEVDALLTVDDRRETLGLIVVNKFPRPTRLELSALLPIELRNRGYAGRATRFAPDDAAPRVLPGGLANAADERFTLAYDLAPETVYTFLLAATPASPTPPVPTGTPTAAPPSTSTPAVPTATARPSPEPTAVRGWGMTLEMPAHHFRPDDPCYLRAWANNDGTETYRSIKAFVILDIGTGDYWFAPSWNRYPPEIDMYVLDLPVGRTRIAPDPLGELAWPPGAGSGESFRFLAAATNAEVTEILGETAEWEFSYSPD